MEDAAQMDEQIDTGCRCQRARLRVQVSEPAKNVWITLQLVKRTNVRVVGPKPCQEVASGAAIVTNRLGMKSRPQRIDSLLEVLRQRMLERGTTRTVHEIEGLIRSGEDIARYLDREPQRVS